MEPWENSEFVRKLQDTESLGTLVLQTMELSLQCVSVPLPGVADCVHYKWLWLLEYVPLRKDMLLPHAVCTLWSRDSSNPQYKLL